MTLLLTSVWLLASTAAAQELLQTVASPNEEQEGIFGFSVAGVPDADGDGRDDLLVGAYGEDPDSAPVNAGRAYLFSGSTGALLRTLTSPNEEAGARFGWTVSGVPDADGDGRGDLLIGAYKEDPGASPTSAGRAYLFSGSTGALLRTLTSPNEEAGARFGWTVSGVPDADGDGRGDLLVGAFKEDPGASPEDAGRAYLFSGSTGALLQTLASPNEEIGGIFGFSVAGVPDADGDGRGDLLVGANREDPGCCLTDAGRVYLFSGSTGALLQTLASPSEEASARFGWTVSGVPDADGDGRGDLLVGAFKEDPGASPEDAGRAYLFSGSTGALLRTLASPNEENGGRFGFSVAGIPDTDDDGRGDLLIGAFREDPGASPEDAGRAYLFSGSTGTLLQTVASPNEEAGGGFGFSVAGVSRGGEGGNFLVGTFGEDPGASPVEAGRAYLFGEVPPLVLTLIPTAPPPPVVLARGEEVSFTATFTAGPDVPASFDYWTEATLPNGAVRGPLLGPSVLMVDPNSTESLSFSQRVPNIAPLGDYVYTMKAGTFPDMPIAVDSFDATVVSAAREAGLTAEAWLAYDAEGNVISPGTVTDLRRGSQAAARAEEAARPTVYPNPFRSNTTIKFALDEAGPVSLAIYDVMGRKVATLIEGPVEGGSHEVHFDGRALAAGAYVWRLEAGGVMQTGSVVRIR